MSQEIAQEIQRIQERNARVAADKAWEGSFVRRGLIAVLTYVVVVIVLFISQVPNPFLGAIIPPIGYLLSTLTLPFIKSFWIKNMYDER